MTNQEQAEKILNSVRSIVGQNFTDPVVQRTYTDAITALVALNDNDVLIDLLETEFAAVRTGAGSELLCGPICEALAQNKAKKAAPLLGRIFTDPSCRGLMEDLAEILGQLGDASVEPFLRQALTNTEAGVRAKAAAALASLGCRQASGAIAMLLDDDSDTVREQAIAALVKLQAVDSAHVLASILENDEDSYIRAEAARALGKLGVKEAVPLLQKIATQKTNEELSEAAEEALAMLGFPA